MRVFEVGGHIRDELLGLPEQCFQVVVPVNLPAHVWSLQQLPEWL